MRGIVIARIFSAVLGIVALFFLPGLVLSAIDGETLVTRAFAAVSSL